MLYEIDTLGSKNRRSFLNLYVEFKTDTSGAKNVRTILVRESVFQKVTHLESRISGHISVLKVHLKINTFRAKNFRAYLGPKYAYSK